MKYEKTNLQINFKVSFNYTSSKDPFEKVFYKVYDEILKIRQI